MPQVPRIPPRQPATRGEKPAVKPPVKVTPVAGKPLSGGAKKPNPIGIYPPPVRQKPPANDLKSVSAGGVKSSPLVGATKQPPRKGMR